MIFSEWIILSAICFLSAVFGAVWLNRQSNRVPPADPLLLEPSPDPTPQTSDTAIFTDAPIAIWTTNDSGRLVWANAAYRSLCDWRGLTAEPGETTIFPHAECDPAGDKSSRVEMASPDGSASEWYEVTRSRQNGDCVHYAQNVTALVSGEETRRAFYRTMADTFAQLSTGLAIFDQDHRLQLFNPALVDLVGLPFSFLSSRPDLASFFDRLRESQSMPEPRDYAAWRTEMSDLARAAAEGRYQETWTLPSGSVYQVTGRPHPGGAIAFLFEDISAEVGLARQFRSELATYRAVLDSSEEAVCVFSGSDRLIYANTAYRAAWSGPEDDDERGLSLDDACAAWNKQTGGTLDARQIRDHARRARTIAMPAGDTITTLRPDRLPRGDLLIRFRPGDQQTRMPASYAMSY